MELTQSLAQHLVSTTFEQLPSEAREATKRSILDCDHGLRNMQAHLLPDAGPQPQGVQNPRAAERAGLGELKR
jgi:hypothetical protein